METWQHHLKKKIKNQIFQDGSETFDMSIWQHHIRLFNTVWDVLSAYIYSSKGSRTPNGASFEFQSRTERSCCADGAAGLNACNSCSFLIGPERRPIALSAGFRTSPAANRSLAAGTGAADSLLTSPNRGWGVREWINVLPLCTHGCCCKRVAPSFQTHLDMLTV